MRAPPTALHCDIFCRVIDNFGDAGVCWRLARQLVREHGWRVRLVIDDAALIARMAPGQRLVEILPWPQEDHPWETADVVIEAFACTLPAAYLAAMRARARPPVWINLEYLSAEDWVVGCHGLPSPQAGLAKFFFFPGFVSGTGGLLRERELAVPPAPTFPRVLEHPRGVGSNGAVESALPTPPNEALEISLFCYENPQLPTLLDAWCASACPIHCHVCAGLPREQVERWLGGSLPAQRGALTLDPLPFLPQADFDALLGRCHLNFVRGEDSFVRAQWVERPFVWQAYPQGDNAHLAKLDAFLRLYSDDAVVQAFFRAWNGVGPLDWCAFAARLPALTRTAHDWAVRIAAAGDLASNLVRFCQARL